MMIPPKATKVLTSSLTHTERLPSCLSLKERKEIHLVVTGMEERDMMEHVLNLCG